VNLFEGLKCLYRESRAVDMESLCVISGKLVWAVRVDLHILDNGGLFSFFVFLCVCVFVFFFFFLIQLILSIGIEVRLS
jgi:exosome complex RNA-binding protein Rrp42 (RNase PH superfamily)